MPVRTVRSALVAMGLLWGLFVLLAGCDVLQPPAQPTAVPTETTAAPTPTSAPEITQLPEEGSNLIPIVVWLPPQFDPDLNTDAGRLMRERLESFNLEHPNLSVSYRVKDEVGPAGLLGSLSSTSKVAPQALPDLVLFSDDQLNIAIEGSLAYPYSSPIPSEDDTDWYDVAGEMNSYQGQTYSLPLAVNGLVMVYKTNLIEEIPASWDDLLRSGYLVAFPPADPDAAFTLALYLSEGGTLFDPDNGIGLQADALQNVFSFYHQLEAQAQLPNNPTQIDSDQEAWDLFLYGSRQVAVTDAYRYFGQPNEEVLAAPLLTADGIPMTVVNGWGWALTNPDPNKQVAAAELARYLGAPEFTGPWTEAADLLPLRPTAIDHWENEAQRDAAQQLLVAAMLRPSTNVTSIISPALQEAVISVLNGEKSPEEAAQDAVDQFEN